jgi:hypothetical protein
MEVHHKDNHRQGNSGAPEDVGSDPGPERILGIWKDLSNDASGRCCDYCTNDWEKPDRCHALERWRCVYVHSARSISDYMTAMGDMLRKQIF